MQGGDRRGASLTVAGLGADWATVDALTARRGPCSDARALVFSRASAGRQSPLAASAKITSL